MSTAIALLHLVELGNFYLSIISFQAVWLAEPSAGLRLIPSSVRGKQHSSASGGAAAPCPDDPRGFCIPPEAQTDILAAGWTLRQHWDREENHSFM